MDPPLIPLIKSENYEKSDKYCVKIKLLWDTTSQKLDLHELKMALFDNGEPEEFLLFIRNACGYCKDSTPSYTITCISVTPV